ncbi:MAG: dual specificity protein phosphatase family protein [Saccharospirillaceae bacterium]|nr:dual specificity protein phosphatase family protein [Pseudomonadales bacterium]NRB81750.1 dual specificity protein phosphatase family protein [Saccharospirillaceae bacterium]
MTNNIELKQQIQDIIKQVNTVHKDNKSIAALIENIKIVMQSHPNSRIELGACINQLNTIKKELNQPHKSIQWVNLLAGSISIGHRPKIKDIKIMKSMGVTHIFTLLSEKEGAKKIEEATLKQDLTWLWLPLATANPPTEDKYKDILYILNICQTQLKQGAKIYIHCSAGIHRTGMITYALLKHLGFDKDQALTLLSKMRTVTGKNVGIHRIAWGDSFA